MPIYSPDTASQPDASADVAERHRRHRRYPPETMAGPQSQAFGDAQKAAGHSPGTRPPEAAAGGSSPMGGENMFPPIAPLLLAAAVAAALRASRRNKSGSGLGAARQMR